MTAGGTFTQRVDICTTASSFIELAMQDRSKGLPLNSIPANAATISQATANSVATSLFIDDQRPVFNSLVTDYYIAGSSTSSNTSKNVPNVVANHPNELLLAFVTIQNGVTTVSSITGGGLTWVNVSRANAKAGSTEVWRAFAPTPQSFTATITFSAATTSDNWVFVGIVGADMTGTNGSGAIGATAATSSTSAAPTVSITTTRNNSWVWGAGNDGTSNVTVVAGSGQTILRNNGDSTNVTTGWVQRQNAITATSGTSVTMNDTTPSADSCNILAIEILPAIYHNLGAQGAGG